MKPLSPICKHMSPRSKSVLLHVICNPNKPDPFPVALCNYNLFLCEDLKYSAQDARCAGLDICVTCEMMGEHYINASFKDNPGETWASMKENVA